MENNNLKNIVVLKNLPSNIVEEAIVILKPNKKIKEIEIVNKNQKTMSKEEKEDGYVIKEAEMLVAKYISKIESKNASSKTNDAFQLKYKRLKKYACFLSFVLLMSIILNFI